MASVVCVVGGYERESEPGGVEEGLGSQRTIIFSFPPEREEEIRKNPGTRRTTEASENALKLSVGCQGKVKQGCRTVIKCLMM